MSVSPLSRSSPLSLRTNTPAGFPLFSFTSSSSISYACLLFPVLCLSGANKYLLCWELGLRGSWADTFPLLFLLKNAYKKKSGTCYSCLRICWYFSFSVKLSYSSFFWFETLSQGGSEKISWDLGGKQTSLCLGKLKLEGFVKTAPLAITTSSPDRLLL